MTVRYTPRMLAFLLVPLLGCAPAEEGAAAPIAEAPVETRVPHPPTPNAPPEPVLPALPAVPASDAPGPAATEEGSAQSKIRATMTQAKGRFQTCVEKALADAPATRGRVSVGWSIVEGRVTTARLVSNTTGNDALGGCMVRAVQTLRFDATVTADVAEFPWVIDT